jgi:hypothetical protein
MEKLIDRIKNILLSPKPTWEEIKSEDTDQKTIVRDYLLYLVAVPVVASFIGKVIVGLPVIGYRVPFFSALVWAIVMYVLYFVGIYIAALVVSALAPSFGGVKDDLAAFKIVAYSYTAPLVAGIFGLIPALSPLAILGLYGIYLFYVGLPLLMECPQEKALAYTVVSVIIMIIIAVVMSGISGLFLLTG